MAGTDRNAHGASLAACQENVTGPIKPVVALHIACEIARLVQGAHAKEAAVGKRVTHVPIFPENVFVGYDGNVEVLGIPGMQRMQASPPNPAYYAPEQVSGSATDLRTEVFALGVVLWELFAGVPLFARGTAAETRMAISEGRVPYVCDANPEVPKPIADTLVTALRFDKQARFETLEAFTKALINARAASGISAAAHKMDVATWLGERVPKLGAPGFAAPPGPGFASPPALGFAPPPAPGFAPPPMSNPPVSSPPFGAPPVSAPPMVPDLELGPSTRAPAVSAPPPQRAPAAAPPPAVRSASPPKFDPSSMGSGKTLSFDDDDDDPFDMEIERNVSNVSAAHSSSSRGPGAGPRPSGGLRPGLELAAPSRMARAAAAAEPQYADEPGIALKAAGTLLSSVIAGGTAFLLWKYVYHARGFDVTRALPHAFDGTSATASGVISLVALVVAIGVGFVGLKLRPHAWTVVAAGGVTLLLAIAMITVTLGSTGENSVPPDGGLLVPYLLPLAIVLVALGIVGRAGRRFAMAYGARKLVTLPIATIAGVVGYVAFELSRFAR